jgi:hypothetical protein
MSALRVELFFDQQANNWHYSVPALHISWRTSVAHHPTEDRPLTGCAAESGHI